MSRALLSVLSKALPAALGLASGLSILASGLSILLMPRPVSAEQALEWARVDFLRNRVQLVPSQQRARRARISDILGIGDSLRTARSSRAELRFNDGSLARIGERATFRFTPNTRNFQLTNGTALLLIPPERGRSTIQTPNAVTGIQGSALFVRYIPETNTTIVGALTDNPDGPMVLFNRDGSEQQALRANEIGVIEGDQITQLYQFDGELFWQSSGLAEGFNYLNDSSSTGSDALDAVRQEIRDAIANKPSLDGGNVIENPSSFSLPAPDEVPANPTGDSDLPDADTDFVDEGLEEEAPLPFENTPADEYLNSAAGNQEDRNSLESQQPASTENPEKPTNAGSVGSSAGEGGDGEADPEDSVVEESLPVEEAVTEDVNVKPDIAPGVDSAAGSSSGEADAGEASAGGANSEAPVAEGNTPDTSPVGPSAGGTGSGTIGDTPGTNNPLLAPTAIMEEEPMEEEKPDEEMGGTEGSTPDETPGEGGSEEGDPVGGGSVDDAQTPPDDTAPTDAAPTDGSSGDENPDVTGGAVTDGENVSTPAEPVEDPTSESPDAGSADGGSPDTSNAGVTEGPVEVIVPGDAQSPAGQPENPLIIDDGEETPSVEEVVPEPVPVEAETVPVETETVPVETVPAEVVPEAAAPEEIVPPTDALIIPETETVPEIESIEPVGENFLDVSDVVDAPLMTEPMTEMTESMTESMNNMGDGENGNGDVPVTPPNVTTPNTADTPADNPATNGGADNPATNGSDNPATNGADSPGSPATSGSDNPVPTDDRPTN
ncbi:MAG: FecR domain-containing protein [Cyanobacteria bacterium P01_F01_bin.53]